MSEAKRLTKNDLYAKLGELEFVFQPEFRPSHIEVILDEGVKEMRGNYIRLLITNIIYEANFMRIYVHDYRRGEI